MKAEIVVCQYCGGIGEWGWAGRPCPFCEGNAEALSLDGRTYPLTGKYNQVYRDNKGRFTRIPLGGK